MEVKHFLKSKGIDTETRIDMPNGGIYLTNLMQQFAAIEKVEVLTSVKSDINLKLIEI